MMGVEECQWPPSVKPFWGLFHRCLSSAPGVNSVNARVAVTD